jgi:hypothetical protein
MGRVEVDGGPRRTCVGCRRIASAGELVRISRPADGALRIGIGPGRGAWICAPPSAVECLDAAQRRRSLDRALRTSLLDDEVSALRATLEHMSG